jgi:pimeloyl-ACP methyl ester carboxylesterase
LAFAVANDDVRLYYEETGSGTPVLFVHEFAGDHRSWEPQLRWFGLRYRAVAYAARGYPPSDVPADPGAYGQEQAVRDGLAILDDLGIDRAHVVGLSMGGFCALHMALDYPQRCRSIVTAGVGYGAHPDEGAAFREEAEATAAAFERDAAAAADGYAAGPSRLQLRDRNPRAYDEFRRALRGHDPRGSALTLRGVQARRPSLYDLRDRLATVEVPTLILVGDEDDGCLEPALMLKRTMPTAALAVLPRAGHTLNLEDPAAFNVLVAEFLVAVDAGRWSPRDRPA